MSGDRDSHYERDRYRDRDRDRDQRDRYRDKDRDRDPSRDVERGRDDYRSSDRHHDRERDRYHPPGIAQQHQYQHRAAQHISNNRLTNNNNQSLAAHRRYADNIKRFRDEPTDASHVEKERWKPQQRSNNTEEPNRPTKSRDRETQHTANHQQSNGIVDSSSNISNPTTSSSTSSSTSPSISTARVNVPATESVSTTLAVVDLNDDDAAKREEKELEERRRRRAEILAKHNSRDTNARTETRTTTLEEQPPQTSTAESMINPSSSLLPTADSNVKTAESTSNVALTSSDKDNGITNGRSVSISISSRSSSDNTAVEYDMFSDSPSLLLPSRPVASSSNTAAPDIANMAVSSSPSTSTSTSGAGSDLLDSWDDAEGYYKYRLGDILTDTSNNKQYRVCGLQGSGVFSTVLRVKPMFNMDTDDSIDTNSNELVIKMMRNNDTMYKAGVKESEFLRSLAIADPSHKKHVIHLISSFIHRSHLCLVFPAYAMDLRKVIKKYGSIGLSLSAVRLYAQQLLIGLKLLMKCHIVHGDIKPDNLLVSDQMHLCTICDFGSASWLTDCEITPYLISRFYRAPEIILGLPYNHAVDLWSVGCVLYELYTGKILFAGQNNNEMLLLHQEMKGRLPLKYIKPGHFSLQHFDLNTGQFLRHRRDPVTENLYTQAISLSQQPSKDLYSLLKSYSGINMKDMAEVKRLKQLSEFIHQCLILEPDKRPSLDTLLQHPFVRDEPS